MISAFAVKSASAAAGYYDKAFNQDGAHASADNYYLAEQAPATWQGRGAALLNIEGEAVKRDDFVAFLSGVLPDPRTGEIQDLSRNSRGADRRAGFDFTVSPPKSVSLVALVGGDDRVKHAHLEANAAAMDWLERHAAVIRVRDEHGDTKHVQAGNLLYASVLHETNRANEPQLHNHNVIVSAVYDEDAGKWRSLTNDQLFKLRTQADAIYKSELSHALQAVGYKLDFAANGTDFEISGISEAQLDAFSSRRGQIKAALEKRGIELDGASFEARQAAALDSRSAKKDVPRATLHSVWGETAQSVGLNLNQVVEEARNRKVEVSRSDFSATLRAVSWAIEHLSEREQAFSLPDLETEALQFGRGRISEVQRAIGVLSENRAIVEGQATPDGARVVTTPQAIEHELLFAQRIQAGKGRGLVVIDSDAEFSDALKRFEERKTQETGNIFKLSQEQVAAARNLLMHADAYQAVQGDAGTGKTAALEMVREAAERKGWRVLGVATSAAAAKELQRSSGIQSDTVAGFFVDRDNAIRLTEMRMAELRTAIANREQMRIAPVPRTEVRTLSIGDSGPAADGDRHVFDRQRGEVFRSVDTLRNSLSRFLVDVASRARESASPSSDTARAKLMGHVATAAESFGRSLATYEKVGRIESVDAHTALYVEKEASTATLPAAAGMIRMYHGSATHGRYDGKAWFSSDRDYAAKFREGAELQYVDVPAARINKIADPDGYGQTVERGFTVNVELDSAEVGIRRPYVLPSPGQEAQPRNLEREYERAKADLDNLQSTGNAEGRKTLLVMDESSMTGVADALKVSDLANAIGARLVLQGDVKQHESVPAGRAFRQAQEAGMNLSVLEETRRFDNATEQTKLALQKMKEGNFGAAYASLNITEVDQQELATKVAARYLDNLNDLKGRGETTPNVGVVVVTNADRKAFNGAIHDLLAANGLISQDSFEKQHLDDPKLTAAQQFNVGMLRRARVDQLIFRKSYAEIGVNKGEILTVERFDVGKNLVYARAQGGRQVVVDPRRQDYFSPARRETRRFAARDLVEARANIKLQEKGPGRISNGSRGVITSVDDQGGTVRWADGRITRLSNDQFRVIDHAYAHTTFREQGATTHREIIAISKSGAKVMNTLAAYVAATRAKENTEIVTSDKATLLKNVDRDLQKTTALDRQSIERTSRGEQIDFDRVAAPLLMRTSQTRSLSTSEQAPSLQQGDKGRELER